MCLHRRDRIFTRVSVGIPPWSRNRLSLLAVTGPSNRRVYPTVQFNRDGSVVSGLKVVREALPTENSWAILNFLVRPDSRLNGRKPIDLLRDGKVDLVVQAARGMGEQGA
jgi:hypothetical protein